MPTRGGGHPQGGEGTHKGCPYLLFPAKKPAFSCQRRMEFTIAHYGLHSSRRCALKRAPTRGAPTRFRQPHVGLSQFDAIALPRRGTENTLTPFIIHEGPRRAGQTHLSAHKGGEGTHKGCPYLLFPAKKPAFSCQRRMEFAIAHYGLHSSRRYALRRAPTRGAPTNCLLSAVCPAKGAHKGRPCRLASLGGMPCEGHPQGAPLPIGFSRRYALRRAPTRGAPTRFRQPHVGLSQFDAIALHEGARRTP